MSPHELSDMEAARNRLFLRVEEVERERDEAREHLHAVTMERDMLREQRGMALGLVDACATFIGDKGFPDEARRIIERAKGLA